MKRKYLTKLDCGFDVISDYDVVVLGTGIAGLFSALTLNSQLRVLVITKDQLNISNTNLAQGGIAVTVDKRKAKGHVDDTVVAGNNYNNRDVVEMVIDNCQRFLDEMIKLDVRFDVDQNGELLLTREGGHNERRILHSKDSTGKEIVRALSDAVSERANIDLWENTFAIDVLTSQGVCAGISVIKDGHLNHIYASKVIIATGGIGKVYEKTTNERICTGDGMAMAIRAGAMLKDMEFVQFHPTAFDFDGDRNFLISEAVRGEGGILRNSSGEAFMDTYHPLKDLAPRNVVSMAIYEQITIHGSEKVYLDVTHLDKEYIKNRFPMIYEHCLKKGINITEDFIPITPVQHYIMGGIYTDTIGRSTVKNLYACGEVANTGMHGANRMASNSLLEGLVFAGLIAEDINQLYGKDELSRTHGELDDCLDGITGCSTINIDEVRAFTGQLKRIMSGQVGMVRTKEGLDCALGDIKAILGVLSDRVANLDECQDNELDLKEYFELMNMLEISKRIVIGALNRPLSLGGHVMIKE